MIEHRLVLFAGLLAALPVVVAAIRALVWHWFPVSDDDGVIATRAVDVFTGRSPLVGQYSQASLLTGRATYSPGPMLYWLLAIPAQLGANAVVLTMSLVNGVAVVGVVGLARRRGGTGLMLIVSVGIAVMCHSLGTERLHDIWNPYVAVLPLLLLIFVCWSLACGDYRLLPWAVLIASFVAQAQVAFAFPALGALIVGLVGVTTVLRQGDWNSARLRRSVAAAFVVGLLCWSAPLYDQAIHRPGNLVAIVQAGTGKHGTLGGSTAWRAVVRTVGFPPWWLRDPPSNAQRVFDVAAVSTLGAVTASLVLAGLLAVTFAGLRQRRKEVVAVGAMGLLLCAAVAVVAGTTPTLPTLKLTIAYTLWWASPVGMWIYLSLGWASASLLKWPPRRLPLGRRSPARLLVSGWLLTAAGLALVVAAASYAAATQAPDELQALYKPARAISAPVAAALPSKSYVRIDPSPSLVSLNLQAGLVYALRRDGMRVAVGPFSLTNLDRSYHGRPPYDRTVRIHDGEPALPGERVVARVVVAAHGAGPRTVSVGVAVPGS